MIKILESIAEKELYMGYIFGIMILGGYIREYRVLDDVYSLAKKYIKDNRLMIIVTSIFCGVLPIPGRVALSAPLLDAIAPPTKRDRSNYGIIDYLSTHHYYWWSPLEKTIILPMAALGITYREMLSYTFIPLLICLGYTWWFIFTRVDPYSVVPSLGSVREFNWRSALRGWAPFIATIWFLLCVGKAGAILFFPWFAAMCCYYAWLCKDWRWGRYINKQFAIISTIVLALGGVVGMIKEPVMVYLKSADPTMIIPVTIVGMIAAYIMGSSGKYAGMTSALVLIFGQQYLVWFLATEYSGYLLSPAHKCLMIGQQYFGTPIKKYYKVLSGMCALLIGYAFIVTFIF